MTVWGVDGDLNGNESRLMIRLPIFQISNDKRLGVASIQPWSPDNPSTIRWLHNESRAQAVGTQLDLSIPMNVSPNDVVLLAGPLYLNALRKIDEHEILSGMNVIQVGFATQIASPNESVKLCERIGSLARQHFDSELKQEKCQRVTDEAKACLHILQGTPTVLLDEIVRRKLLVFLIEKDFDAYTRSLELGAIRLEKESSDIEKNVLRYKDVLLDQVNENLPEEIQHAIAFRRSALGDWKRSIASISKLPDISVITSDYTGISSLEQFQKKLLVKLREHVENKHLLSTNTKKFQALGEIERIRKKYIFAFPMYLTMDKTQEGFFTITYGKLERLGLIVPADNVIFDAYPDSSKALKLSRIITEAVNHGLQILCLENYAMKEIVKQCAYVNQIDNFTDNTSITVSTSRGFEYIPAIKNNKSIFLYDLGDKPKVMRDKNKAIKKIRSAPLDALPLSNNMKMNRENYIANVVQYDNIEVDADIPVGIGFNINMIDWFLEDEERFKVLKKWTFETIEELGLSHDLNTLGISLLFPPEQLTKREPVSSNKHSSVIVQFKSK